MSARTLLNDTKEPKRSTFEKLTGHRRNRTLEKLISTSTIMAPTHDRVVGLDPDDVKTPISTPHARTWEKETSINEVAPLPVRASTDPKNSGNRQTVVDGEEEGDRPPFPSRPTDVASYGGAEATRTRTRTQEKKDHIKENMNTILDKGRSLANVHHKDPKSTYFRLETRINQHLQKQFLELCKKESTLRTSELVRWLREEQGQPDVELPVGMTEMREFEMKGERRWAYKEWLAFICRSGALEGVRPVSKVGLLRSEEVNKQLKKGEQTDKEVAALGFPITSYFIDSSHNTYLQGHQWFSESHQDAYKYVLQKGCRCIEIDVHNGDSVLKKGGGASSYIKPTVISEAISVTSEKLDKGKSKIEKKMSSFRKSFHKKMGSISGSKKSPRTEELSKGVDEGGMGHRRNQSSIGIVPTISRDPTSDSEGDANVDSYHGSAVDLTGDGKPTSNKSSRASSKSSASSFHPERTGEPIVMHGWTPTTKWCLFRDVCKTVAQHAFETTNLPLIVSLEVACSLEQQELMVTIMKEEWRDMLVDNPLSDCDPTIRQPRLDELFKKILVKVKRHVPHGEEISDAAFATSNSKDTMAPNSGDISAAPLTSDATPTTGTPSASTLSLQASSHLTPTTVSTSVSSITPTATPSATLSPSTSGTQLAKLDTSSTKSSTRSRSPSNPAAATKPPKLPKICKTLSDLGIYTHSAHFGAFTDTSSYSPSHIYSIDESGILDLYEKQAAAMHAHNKKYFMRVYPEWKRIGSSNLDPSVYWRKGVQMAAVNAQTWDEGTMVNRGMFEETGGWVLKPANLRPPTKNPTWNPEGKTREEAEAGLVGAQTGVAQTPTSEHNMSLSPTSYASPTNSQPGVGLGLTNAGIESQAELASDSPVSRTLPRAAALDPPSRTPSKGKNSKKVKSPRQSNASLGPNPASPAPKTSSTPIIGSPTPSVIGSLVLGQPKPTGTPAQTPVQQPQAVVRKHATVNYYFKIYAAQGLSTRHDADEDLHPRVKIEMHAERDGEYKSDDWKKETKTRHSSNPDWNGEEIRFLGIGSRAEEGERVHGHVAGPQEELSFVRFKIEDDNRVKKDVMLAWRAVRLDRLRVGWRFLRLWDQDGEEGGGLLLIHVRREEILADRS